MVAKKRAAKKSSPPATSKAAGTAAKSTRKKVAVKKGGASPATGRTVAAQRETAGKQGEHAAEPFPATAPPPPRNLSGIDIGHTAGEVWRLLDQGGPQTLAGLKKASDAPSDLVVAAVGWLAREHKLAFRRSGRTVKISLG